jgi:hypothetical protein
MCEDDPDVTLATQSCRGVASVEGSFVALHWTLGFGFAALVLPVPMFAVQLQVMRSDGWPKGGALWRSLR